MKRWLKFWHIPSRMKYMPLSIWISIILDISMKNYGYKVGDSVLKMFAQDIFMQEYFRAGCRFVFGFFSASDCR